MNPLRYHPALAPAFEFAEDAAADVRRLFVKFLKERPRLEGLRPLTFSHAEWNELPAVAPAGRGG